MLTSFEVIPDHTIAKHLGLINLFIIRETTALYEVSPSAIIHFICVTTQHLAPLSLMSPISLLLPSALSLSLFVTSVHLVTILTSVTVVTAVLHILLIPTLICHY